MFEPRRYRGVVLTGASVLAAVLLADALLLAALGRTPTWLQVRDEPTDIADQEHAGCRVAGAQAQRRRAQASPGPLAVILGRSTAREGIDPTVLTEYGPRPLTWLSLYGMGGSTSYLEDLVRLLDHSELRPALVVVAVNPFMLAGRPYTPPQAKPFDPAGPARALREGKWGAAWHEVSAMTLPRSWTLSNRPLAGNAYRRALLRRRMDLLKACGQRLDAVFAPDPDPWHVQLLGYPARAAPERLEYLWQLSEQLGRFRPSSYDAADPRAVTLVRVLDHYRSQGARVCLVLMPENSTWRQAMPPEARRVMVGTVRDHFTEEEVPILDLADVLTDGMFVDYFHPNAQGRRALSQLLAERLRAGLAR